MKKRVFIMLFCLSCIFCGCKNTGGEKNAQSEVEQVMDDDVSVMDFEYDEIDRKLILQNLATDEIVVDLSIEGNEVIDSSCIISDGYAVVKSVYDEDINNTRESEGIVISSGISDEKAEYDYIVYDENLQEKKRVDLKALLSDETMQDILECQPEPMIDPSGQKIAWAVDNDIYMLDLNSGEQINLGRDDSFYEIAFVDENKLGFYSSTGDNTIVTKYGYWDLNTNEVYYSEEEDYCASQIRVSGEYLILNDAENPATNSSSGKVLLYDCEKNQSSVIKVDNIESTFATITEDGDEIIAYTDKNSDLTEHMVRVYRVSDGKCISESPFTTDNGVYFYDFLGKDNTYYLVGSKDEEKVIYRAFTAE